MSIALNNIRVHKNYILTNYGEQFEFTVLEIHSDTEFLLKDLHTMEMYKMSEILLTGKGEDFSLWEI